MGSIGEEGKPPPEEEVAACEGAATRFTELSVGLSFSGKPQKFWRSLLAGKWGEGWGVKGHVYTQPSGDPEAGRLSVSECEWGQEGLGVAWSGLAALGSSGMPIVRGGGVSVRFLLWARTVPFRPSSTAV